MLVAEDLWNFLHEPTDDQEWEDRKKGFLQADLEVFAEGQRIGPRYLFLLSPAREAVVNSQRTPEPVDTRLRAFHLQGHVCGNQLCHKHVLEDETPQDIDEFGVYTNEVTKSGKIVRASFRPIWKSLRKGSALDRVICSALPLARRCGKFAAHARTRRYAS